MQKKWKEIRVFISSTFIDMHAERDHLLRFVFPKLKEKCRKKRVHLIDVDLRWGVTEKDAQDGKALDICLDEIDSCRPYFLGLLGHRYGWIPQGEEHSITSSEIYHGVLNNDIPIQIVDLKRLINDKLEGKDLTDEQKRCLKSCYRWEASLQKYLLRDEVSADELNIIQSIFKNFSSYQRDRSFFFFRSERLTRELAGANFKEYFEEDQIKIDKLAVLKEEINKAGLPWFEYDYIKEKDENDIGAFGRKVGDILLERIKAEFDEPEVEEEKTWLEEETEFHELFMSDRTRRFVGRRDLLKCIQDFSEKDSEPSIMVITGEAGIGKSALMSRFTEEATLNHPDWFIIPHFIGASPSSTNLRKTLFRICNLLNHVAKWSDEITEDIEDLKKIFPNLLKKASEEKKIVIILDAVNQFEKIDDAHTMHWFPFDMNQNVRFIISALMH